jgi:hypothetical protein
MLLQRQTGCKQDVLEEKPREIHKVEVLEEGSANLKFLTGKN